MVTSRENETKMPSSHRYARLLGVDSGYSALRSDVAKGAMSILRHLVNQVDADGGPATCSWRLDRIK